MFYICRLNNQVLHWTDTICFSPRVVLMSATADIARYKDYFRDLGRGERVEVIAVPSAPQHSIFQRKVLYLEEASVLTFI